MIIFMGITFPFPFLTTTSKSYNYLLCDRLQQWASVNKMFVEHKILQVSVDSAKAIRSLNTLYF